MANSYGVIQVVRDFLKGNLRAVPNEVAQARLDTCKACEAYNVTLRTCSVCGCLMPAKVKLRDASCPMELWGEYTEPPAET